MVIRVKPFSTQVDVTLPLLVSNGKTPRSGQTRTTLVEDMDQFSMFSTLSFGRKKFVSDCMSRKAVHPLQIAMVTVGQILYIATALRKSTNYRTLN